MRGKRSDLEEKYNRKYLELEEFEKIFNSFKLEKESMSHMRDELAMLRK